MIEFVLALVFWPLLAVFFYCFTCLFRPWGGMRSRAHAAWGLLGSFAAQVALAAAPTDVAPLAGSREKGFDFGYFERCLGADVARRYESLDECQRDVAWAWALAEMEARGPSQLRFADLELGPVGRAVYRAARQPAAGDAAGFAALELCLEDYEAGLEHSFWACAHRNNKAWVRGVRSADSPLTLAESENEARRKHSSFSESNWRVYRAAFNSRRALETVQQRQLREAKLQALERQRKRERLCRHDKSGAYIRVRTVVEWRLGTSSSLQFPWSWTDHMNYAGDCTYVVRSFVESGADDGATRTPFEATVRYAAGDVWQVQKLRLN